MRRLLAFSTSQNDLPSELDLLGHRGDLLVDLSPGVRRPDAPIQDTRVRRFSAGKVYSLAFVTVDQLIASIREVAHQACQYADELPRAPQAPTYAADNARVGVKIPRAGVALLIQVRPREVLVSGHRIVQRVVLPVLWKIVGGDAVFRFHLLPETRARQRRQDQHVENVQSVAIGSIGDLLPDPLPIGVESHDE